MADFLVLEEDGTSHLELEESTDDFLLETPPPPAPTSRATWKVGSLTVPSSTGTVAVTGLGGTPAAVFFWGTNWTTEDTAITTPAGLGLYRGMASPEFDSPGTIVQNVGFSSPAGDFYEILNDYCIVGMPTPSGTPDQFRASLDSFDVDGFTVDFDAAASGGYKVLYAALMDVVNVGGYVGANTTNLHGWKTGAMLCHAALNGPHVGDLSHSAVWWGGAAYPGTTGGAQWMGAGMSANTFPPAAGAPYIIGIYHDAPTTKISDTAAFTGPFLTPSNAVAGPSGGTLESFDFNPGNSNAGIYVAWDDEDSATGLLTPAQDQGDTVTVSGLDFAPGLVIGYTISDEPQGQAATGTVHGAVGMSVVSSDGTQWCSVIDGVDYGAFQSFQRGFADTVNGTSVHAGTIELTNDGFILTTEEDSATTHDWVWHAFGHPEPIVMWVPHIYRRVLGT